MKIRTNPTASLGAWPTKPLPAARGNQALPNTLNMWARPTYTPPKQDCVRPGAQDFLQVKSFGYRT